MISVPAGRLGSPAMRLTMNAFRFCSFRSAILFTNRFIALPPNLFEFSRVMAAPQPDFTVLVNTNRGGKAAAPACYETAAAFIRQFPL